MKEETKVGIGQIHRGDTVMEKEKKEEIEESKIDAAGKEVRAEEMVNNKSDNLEP